MKFIKTKNIKNIKKRGVSLLVSFVLLIALGVMLALIVTNWSRQQTEKITKDIVKDVEGDVRCSDTSINIALVGNCSLSSNTQISVSNKGYFKIPKVKMRTKFNDEIRIDVLEFSQPLELGQTKDLLIGTAEEFIDVIPIVNYDNQDIACVDRKVTVNC